MWLKVLITKTRLLKYTENFTTKTENFQKKNSGSFQISALNIDCGYLLEPPRRGGSYDYPQSMFLSRNENTKVYPVSTSFTVWKWGLRGSKLCGRDFVMLSWRLLKEIFFIGVLTLCVAETTVPVVCVCTQIAKFFIKGMKLLSTFLKRIRFVKRIVYWW